MRTSTVSACLVTILALVWVDRPALGQASFQGLGDLPGGEFWSDPSGISADGSVIVGRSVSASGTEAFRWENSVMTGLGDLPGGDFFSHAHAVSADGSVIVGRSVSHASAVEGPLRTEAFRWENGTMTGLGDLEGGDFYSVGHSVSDNGSVIVGNATTELGREAFRWEDDVMVGLGDLPGGPFGSEAEAVSADGTVVVGAAKTFDNEEEAFRWENGVMTGLGDLPGGGIYSHAHGVSSDGSVIVGTSNSASGSEAFRWEGGIMVGLGDLEGGYFGSSRGLAVSADGTVAVGDGSSSLGNEAFIWDAEQGMRNLRDVLVTDLGLDLTGWTLWTAQDISANGLAIIGDGLNPSGYQEGWIAYVPEPATLCLLGLGGLAVMRRRCQEH